MSIFVVSKELKTTNMDNKLPRKKKKQHKKNLMFVCKLIENVAYQTCLIKAQIEMVNEIHSQLFTTRKN